MKRRILFPLMVLGLVGLGCVEGRKTVSNVETKEAAQANSEPVKKVSPSPEKTEEVGSGFIVVDVPKVIGKSQKEVKALLGEPDLEEPLKPKDGFNYDYSLDYHWGWINFRKNKAMYIHFQVEKGMDNVFPLGDLVGVNFRGVTPSVSNTTANTIYNNTVISGIKFSEVRVVMSDSGYRIMTFRL